MVVADPSTASVGLLAMKSDTEFWKSYLCHNLIISDKAPVAVTAPRRIQNRAHEHNSTASIPIYSDLSSSKCVIEKGGDFLPVNGNMKEVIPVVVSNTPSKFKMLDSCLRK